MTAPANLEPISASEYEVLRVIWAQQPVSSKQIIDFLSEAKDWSASTIKTLISRLNKKGYLDIHQEGRSYLYSARVNQDETEILRVEEAFGGICNTKHGQILSQVIADLDLTEEDLNLVIQALQNYQTKDYIQCSCAPGQCNCDHHPA